MSKPVVVTIPHQLGRAEARRRIEEGFGRLTGQIGPGIGDFNKSWEGDRMTFALSAMGQAISGVLDVQEQDVRLEVLLPGLLGIIANKIKGKLQTEGQLLLK